MEKLESFITFIAPYWKAVVGFLTPGVVAFTAALQDGSPGGSQITGAEWGGILAAMFITGGLVYSTPNKDKTGTHQEESVQPPEPQVEGEAGFAGDALPEVQADKADGNGF